MEFVWQKASLLLYPFTHEQKRADVVNATAADVAAFSVYAAAFLTLAHVCRLLGCEAHFVFCTHMHWLLHVTAVYFLEILTQKLSAETIFKMF